jgi:hypothetical protein
MKATCFEILGSQVREDVYVVLRAVMQCWLVGRYQSSGKIYYLHFLGWSAQDGDRMFHRSADTLLQAQAVLHPMQNIYEPGLRHSKGEDGKGKGEQDALCATCGNACPSSPYLGWPTTCVSVTVNEARRYLAACIQPRRPSSARLDFKLSSCQQWSEVCLHYSFCKSCMN